MELQVKYYSCLSTFTKLGLGSGYCRRRRSKKARLRSRSERRRRPWLRPRPRRRRRITTRAISCSLSCPHFGLMEVITARREYDRRGATALMDGFEGMMAGPCATVCFKA